MLSDDYAAPNPEPITIDDALLNSAQARAQVGDVTAMCIWRWQRDPRVRFPQPDVVINNRNYWRASTITEWKNRMASQPRPTRRPRETA